MSNKNKVNEKELFGEYFKRMKGRMQIEKGTTETERGMVQLYQWDAVQPCNPDTCHIAELCEYEKKGKCLVEIKYLKAVNVMLFKNFADKIDEPTFFRIGMHLMPLYKQLCKMKMYELSVTDPVWEDQSGRLKAEPIYKEVRDTIKLIEMTWKTIGLNKLVMNHLEDIDIDPVNRASKRDKKKYETMGDIPIEKIRRSK